MSDTPAKDEDLWAQALDGVSPLAQAPRLKKPPASIVGATQTRSDESRVMQDALENDFDPADFDTGDETSFRRNGVSRAQIRRLRRGQFTVQATLDLHGMSRRDAAAAIQKLLQTAAQNNWRCLKIIHGKGLRSPGGRPVLKGRVEISLRRNEQVLGYASAPPWNGGHGAMLVLLRQAD